MRGEHRAPRSGTRATRPGRSAAVTNSADATNTPGMPAALEIHDVVHTARRAAASIGERLDHQRAVGGDLVAQIDRRRLGEGRLLVALHRWRRPRPGAVRAGRGTRRRAAWRCRAVRSPGPWSDAGRAQAGALGDAAFAGRIEEQLAHGATLVPDQAGDRLGADVAVGPAADHRREQTGATAGVDDEDAARAELRQRRVAEMRSGTPSAMPSAPRTRSAPASLQPGVELVEQCARGPSPPRRRRVRVRGRSRGRRRSRGRASGCAACAGTRRTSWRGSPGRGRAGRRCTAGPRRRTR